MASVKLISAVRLAAYHSATILEELGGSVLIEIKGLIDDCLHIDD